MKKTYISPDMNVITIEQHLMADPTSAPGVTLGSGSVDAGSVESRRGGLWDDDDED